ncbi:MAG: ATP12 chaperone protein [Alphaproteobacteria bacterium]|nr:MAG: ATP12 chaperone protein [Alphaproteobacteria bacterium]
MSTDDLHAHRRAYKQATARPKDGGAAVLIDGMHLRTPGKIAFLTPTLALAQACADEWNAQEEVVRPDTMPVTRLVNVALDHTARTRDIIVESISGYAATDLVCHRAEHPEALVVRQATAWDPLVAWAGEKLGAPLNVVAGVIAADQPLEAREAFERAARTALAHTVGISGSGVLGFALSAGRLDSVAAFEAACLDDIWQLDTWGEDHFARKRLDDLEAEFVALGRYFAALRA